MNPTCQTLNQWAEAGWLRRLDAALPAFLLEHDPEAQPALLVAAAVLSHMEGRGHTCLPLSHVLTPPAALLTGPPEAQAALHALWADLPTSLPAWQAALRASRVVREVSAPRGVREARPDADADVGQPLVLGAPNPPRCCICVAIGITNAGWHVSCVNASPSVSPWTKRRPAPG